MPLLNTFNHHRILAFAGIEERMGMNWEWWLVGKTSRLHCEEWRSGSYINLTTTYDLMSPGLRLRSPETDPTV